MKVLFLTEEVFMKVNGVPTRTIWSLDDGQAVGIVDQTLLPYRFEKIVLSDWRALADAIVTMKVRGAPLIGIAAAWAMTLAIRDDATDEAIHRVRSELIACRPTAVDLQWGVDQIVKRVMPFKPRERFIAAVKLAEELTQANVLANRAIGTHGAKVIAEIYAKKRAPVNILTHCNAGWLATVDYGTALSAVYIAFEQGIPVHVWVDETRPRNQGLLTAWELEACGVPHTVIVDNAGGHLMQHREVDMVLVGADRITAIGDVANKIGTYLKALAAKDMDVPFYVAAPSSSIDWTIQDGKHSIEIENRDGNELRYVRGLDKSGRVTDIEIISPLTNVENPAFDVTPARLVTGIITERGVCAPEFLTRLFPEGARRGMR